MFSLVLRDKIMKLKIMKFNSYLKALEAKEEYGGKLYQKIGSYGRN